MREKEPDTLYDYGRIPSLLVMKTANNFKFDIILLITYLTYCTFNKRRSSSVKVSLNKGILGQLVWSTGNKYSALNWPLENLSFFICSQSSGLRVVCLLSNHSCSTRFQRKKFLSITLWIAWKVNSKYLYEILRTSDRNSKPKHNWYNPWPWSKSEFQQQLWMS